MCVCMHHKHRCWVSSISVVLSTSSTLFFGLFYAAPITISFPFILFHCTNAAPKIDIDAVATDT